ncbi:hypothetical protein GGS23DRAFT_564030 [Durotheca rogersii]|uniref:uncharacterized protein n=1 Tax=Durotheca rogersii TaxID=419775 RepID=UPI002220A5E0|nr:uncharacterized protein GGS23DRAFT_564030 [Durotheca rogersii]KAI5864362.1 hypothetical protein GGS23DRAFT_564030 [Durotheca rogersii]
MNTDYNLDELDAALSSARHQAASVAGPPMNRAESSSRRTAPSTRRGSLVPPGVTTSASMKGAKAQQQLRQHKLDALNLFNFDLRELARCVLLPNNGGRDSRVSYHEYAVFAPGVGSDSEHEEYRSPSVMSEGEEGLRMFRDAVRNGHGLDDEGNFTANPKGRHLLRGRMRQVIAHRRARRDEIYETSGLAIDGLHLTVEDFESLGLHSGTLPTLQRVTLESSFWDTRRETMYLILSFSSNPQPPYDFLSMAYKVRTKTATALVRRSFDTRWHAEDALDEYERRLDSCRARWSHPLVLPVVLLQVQLFRTEEAVQANNAEVLALEVHVDAVTGTTGKANAEAWRRNNSHHNNSKGVRPLKRFSTNLKGMVEARVGGGGGGGGESAGRNQHSSPPPPPPPPAMDTASFYDPDYVPPQTIHLMKEAHDVLKGAIQLLDTLRWMERALKLIIQAGDELDARLHELRPQQGEPSQQPRDDADEELTEHWHEIRQYLDCTWRLCTSLETDRRMSELRCRAQIDIIYSKMAQEDNNLNARMAVASTRDSSSMKALAVITAIFLPGEYIGTLFGVSMFNWEGGTAGDPAASKDAADDLPHPVIMPSFWIYWAFTIPLTLFIVAGWRAWWVNQDRYFRRHLSTELSNERYWTTDGKPRALETTFAEDFFSGLLHRSGAHSTSNSTILGVPPAQPKTSGSASGASTPHALREDSFRIPGGPLSPPAHLAPGRVLSTRPSGGLAPPLDREKKMMASDSEREDDGAGTGVGRAMRFRRISFSRGSRARRDADASAV